MTVVAWPPPTPPNGRTNLTAIVDAHPSDHNRIADALDTLIARATPIYYGEITAPVSVTATTAAGAQSVINPGNLTYDGGPVLVEFWCQNLQTPNTGAGASTLLNLWDANTDLGFLAQIISPSAGANGISLLARRRLTPTAGAHNFNVRAWVSPSGTGTVSAGPGGPGAVAPASLRIVRA